MSTTETSKNVDSKNEQSSSLEKMSHKKTAEAIENPGVKKRKFSVLAF